MKRGKLFIILFAIVFFMTSLSMALAMLESDEKVCSKRAFRVFITNESYNGNIGGLSGADLICAQSARAAGLSGNWKAWLSDSTTSARQRLYHSSKPYIRLDGRIVAYNWRDLTQLKENWTFLRNAIEINQFGDEMQTSDVMTGTRMSGDAYSTGPSSFCMDYSDTTGVVSFGTSSVIDSDWTITEHENCNEFYHIYCFEQPVCWYNFTSSFLAE